ncbi:DNA translocase FtsK [Ewingella americana]|jgi:S-DNA-T family DNA segregation ATPase FtsK/SpoIIIE|uniref:DNA translocase FtsK n=1 Tax=Ewingella americana TaxID=41202 RepID=UPI00311A63F1
MQKQTATLLLPLDLLTFPPANNTQADDSELMGLGRMIEAFLADHRVEAEVRGISKGPVFTLYELLLAAGISVNRVTALRDDLTRRLSAESLRVLRTIPGKPYIGIELRNKYRQAVYLRDVFDSPEFIENDAPLAVALGQNNVGQPVIADLTTMPHLLVGGMTGSGKSVFLDSLIMSLLYKQTPETLRFILVDPKMLDLSFYEGIPHLLTSVISDMRDAADALRWCHGEMDRRYKLMAALSVRNLADYNLRIDHADALARPIPDPYWLPNSDKPQPYLTKEPYIVVVVDNFSKLTAANGDSSHGLLDSLVRKAHIVGIHLILVNTLPSVDVMASSIKANIPSRIALTVRSRGDSNSILDQGGAELLLGAGDLLYVPFNSSTPIRVHGAYVREQDIHAVVQYWKARGKPAYLNSLESNDSDAAFQIDGDEELDPLFDQAVAFVVDVRRASISGVQRQFRIGYNRAARIVEQMEMQGIVTTPGHNGNREVLAPPSHR